MQLTIENTGGSRAPCRNIVNPNQPSEFSYCNFTKLEMCELLR